MPDLAHAIVETISQPVLVLEQDLSVVRANRAFLQTFEVDERDTLQRQVYDIGNGQWDIAELRHLLGELLDGSDCIENYRVEHAFETIGPRVMLLNARILHQQGFHRILLAIDDITERERIQNELIAGREFADKLIDSVREALVVMDRDLRVERVNQSFCDMFQVDHDEAHGLMIYDLGNGQWDIPQLRKALEEILPDQEAFDDFEVIHDFPGIGRRVMLLNARQLDHMPRILLAIRDETERRKHSESQKLMIGELQHRVKNILANVQSIATATRRRSNRLEDFMGAFLDRLQSVARTQDLLMRGAQGWADLHEVVAFELAAHGWQEDGRLSITGPDVTLTREQTQAIAMVIHELATNALKYGAFARARGRLDIVWTVGGQACLELEWRESGVEINERPKERGFGTGMIESSVKHTLGGDSCLAFEETGVVCRIRFPLDPEMEERR